jgi:hypothetical protein
VQGIELRVHPTLIPAKRLIANVEGAMNAVMVKGDAVGHTMYYGKGAGAEPTASAVIADLVDVARMLTADPDNRVPHLAFQAESMADLPILPIAEVETAYYLRLRVADEPGVLADITRILADAGISIDAVLQREPEEGEHQTDIILLTHRTIEKQVDQAIARIEALSTVLSEGDPYPARRAELIRRTEPMRYVSTRGELPPSPFCDILLGGLAPDGGLVVPERIRASMRRPCSRGARSAIRAGLRGLRRYADDMPDRPARAHRARPTRPRSSARPTSRRCARWRTACTC